MAVTRRRIKRTKKGDFELRLPDEERTVVRSLVSQMREILAEDADPGLRRLYPTAYAEDAERDREYQRLVHDDLLARRLAAFETVEETLDAERLDEEQLVAWMGVLNDTRLVIGTKLDVSEDPTFDIADDDPDAPAYAIYAYLGWLLEQIVDVLNP
ncbi:MAG TPA: DUF2017 family protein [Acidimicrobiales bacterium]|nr:DUF2017 family protein [Acidimicrobiales bacterium]